MIYILIAILGGVGIVLNRVINFNLSDKIGVFQGTFFNYVVGLIFSFIFLIISGEKLFIETDIYSSFSWWVYLGGAVGVLVVALSIYLTPRISAFYLTIFIFLGQLFTGALIDYFISEKFSIGKAIGGLLVLIGLTYNLLLDRNKKG